MDINWMDGNCCTRPNAISMLWPNYAIFSWFEMTSLNGLRVKNLANNSKRIAGDNVNKALVSFP